jgi:RNA polymerase sigma-70 factor (ECF subfamily)
MNDKNVYQEIGPDDRSFVYAVIRRIVRDHEAASDATQDALLLAYRHRDQFRGDASHRTWLYRIAVTTALGHLRKRRRMREEVSPGERPIAWDTADPRPSPEQEVAAGELAGAMTRALDGIDGGHRQVFLLRLGECSETEIADRVGISVANVKIRTHRTRQLLREALREHAVTPHRAPHRARPACRGRRGSRAGSTATSRAS